MSGLTAELQSALAGRYTIEREVGRGGMASVLLARDLKHDRPVALKLLHPELAASLGAERFLLEIRVTARLQHPHILPVLDSGDATPSGAGAPLLWYAMPWVAGETLRARLERERQLSLEPALVLAREIADALAYAHGQGIIHRDIKPENILLSGGHALVADFGIARVVDGQADRLTGTGLALGTPGYMSPEQTLGEPVDLRSDIYSLACIVYEMLAGEPPFAGPTAQAILAARLTSAPRRLNEVRDTVPEGVEAAILLGLARTPADRFATATEFAEALLAGATERARPLPDKSIAVLPFTNLSADPENEFFADGMTEELINALTKVEGLHVVSRTSVFAFKGKQQDVRTVGNRLNVRAVLEGSVRKAGRRLRVAVQLTNVEDGFLLWSETFDREMEDIFAIQDEISRAITNALKVRLMGTTGAVMVKTPTADLEAYAAFLKGRQYWNRRTEADLWQGLGCFFHAIYRDRGYALAHAGIADSYAILGFYCALPPQEAFSKAREASHRALEIAGELAEAHPSLAYVATYHTWDWATADAEFRRAIELNPGYATAHQWYGNYQVLMGRFDEGIASFRHAARLDPLSALKTSAVGWGNYFARRYEEAHRYCRQALELEPGMAVALSWKGIALEQLGDYRAAVDAHEDSVQRSGRNPVSLAMLGHCLGRAGRVEAARRVLDELLVLERRRYVSPFDIATVHLGLGETEPALDRLEQAFAAQDHWMALLKVEPRLDPLRGEPRFQALYQQMRYPG